MGDLTITLSLEDVRTIVSDMDSHGFPTMTTRPATDRLYCLLSRHATAPAGNEAPSRTTRWCEGQWIKAENGAWIFWVLHPGDELARAFPVGRGVWTPVIFPYGRKGRKDRVEIAPVHTLTAAKDAARNAWINAEGTS